MVGRLHGEERNHKKKKSSLRFRRFLPSKATGSYDTVKAISQRHSSFAGGEGEEGFLKGGVLNIKSFKTGSERNYITFPHNKYIVKFSTLFRKLNNIMNRQASKNLF